MMAARLGRWQDVEEGAQESLAKALASLPALREPEAFRGWLRSIAERVASDLASSRRSRPPLPDTEHPSVPHPAEVSERRAAVARAVEGLEEPYRETVVLRYDRGLSCAEIARELGISVGAVTMRLTRAHRELAKPLSAWGEQS